VERRLSGAMLRKRPIHIAIACYSTKRPAHHRLPSMRHVELIHLEIAEAFFGAFLWDLAKRHRGNHSFSGAVGSPAMERC
jgi:hypothetical protein